MSSQEECKNNYEETFVECALNLWSIDFANRFPEGFSVGDTIGYTSISEIKYGLPEGVESKTLKRFNLGIIQSIEMPVKYNETDSLKDGSGWSVVKIGNIHVMNEDTGEYKYVPLPPLVLSGEYLTFSPTLVKQCALEEPNHPQAVLWVNPKVVGQI